MTVANRQKCAVLELLIAIAGMRDFPILFRSFDHHRTRLAKPDGVRSPLVVRHQLPVLNRGRKRALRHAQCGLRAEPSRAGDRQHQGAAGLCLGQR